MASVAAHHAEWLSLVDVSGPFLSVRVLKEALPNGLDAHDPHMAAEVRAALEQWADPDGDGLGSANEAEVHLAFVRFVLHEVLGFENEVLRWDLAATSACKAEVPHVGVLTPDAVLMDGDDAVMLVAVVGPGVRADEIISELGTLTPQERMVEHLKATGLRIGLVTDGERWTLVSSRAGENPGFATWWSSLWGEEKITLQAFRTLLHQDRFLTMGSDETIIGLLDRSAEDQREVTTKLGNQTLQAVEILLRTIDRIDHERGGELLRDVPVAELYDAAVTVMMRLIFLFYAEENDLLPVAEPLYNERYAASTLRERLQAAADQHGEEVLETTHDGWPRLLATWRAVFGGVEHGDMVLAPYGGSLFDPDRYPFLEGRQPETSWTTDAADPLPVDNRTVLHLLNALQTLDEGGQRRKLSFRALDVEQIGHVYEGMLDHTAVRADGWVLGLSGTGGREPEIELDHLESLDEIALLDFLKEQTGRSPATLKKWVSEVEADKAVTNFGATWCATFSDPLPEARTRRFAKLIRPDSTGAPTVFHPGSVYVADSSHRGATGTHYTQRILTEEIVKHALDPLVYIGPSDGNEEDEWVIRTPEEILDLKICDPACGSGAFLVQACRYLADAVVEANHTHRRCSDRITEDEIIDARRQVAERCLHGVDINPMACEMAKLSLWLITLAHDRPFTFLDHAIRNGDSLLGITRLEQLVHLHLDPEAGERLHDGNLFDARTQVQERLAAWTAVRREIQDRQALSAADNERKRAALLEAQCSMEALRPRADLVIGARLRVSDDRSYGSLLRSLCHSVGVIDLGPEALECVRDLVEHGNPGPKPRRPFHWPLEFPEVFDVGGFDATVSNPPFVDAAPITAQNGKSYRSYLRDVVAEGRTGRRGRANLCAYFLLRMAAISRFSGLVCTESIGQGDSREVGLDALDEAGRIIYRAEPSTEWPGSAAVRIAKLWLSSERFERSVLNGLEVARINSRLEAGEFQPELPTWKEAEDLFFMGSVPNGDGFILDADEAARLVGEDPINSEVVRPFLTGKDVTDQPTPIPRRYIINFRDLDLHSATLYTRPFQIVSESDLSA